MENQPDRKISPLGCVLIIVIGIILLVLASHFIPVN